MTVKLTAKTLYDIKFKDLHSDNKYPIKTVLTICDIRLKIQVEPISFELFIFAEFFLTV